MKNIVREASTLATSLLHSTVNRSSAFIVSLLITHIRPNLDNCLYVWKISYLGGLRLLEYVQRQWARELDRLDGVDCGEQPRALQLYSIKRRLLCLDLIKC